MNIEAFDAQLLRRMVFIVHRAWIETRLLAKSDKGQQIYDLADVMELVSSVISRLTPEGFLVICDALDKYEKKYPDAFKYLIYFDKNTTIYEF